MKKNALICSVATILMFASNVFACPVAPTFVQIGLSASSSVGSAGSTGKQNLVTAGAVDQSAASAAQIGNAVVTNAVTNGSAYTNSPKNASAAFAGNAAASINLQTFKVRY